MNESLIDGLLAQLKERGLEIAWSQDRGELVLRGNTKEIDDSVIAAVRAFKPELLSRLRPKDYATCEVCNATVLASITPDDAAAICDKVPTKTTPGCPYRNFPAGWRDQ